MQDFFLPRFTIKELLAQTKPARLTTHFYQPRSHLPEKIYSSLNVSPQPIERKRSSGPIKSISQNREKTTITCKIYSPKHSFLEKGHLKKNLLRNACDSWNVRKFYERKTGKNTTALDQPTMQIDYLHRRRKCEPLCGLFKIKCQQCKAGLDTFNQ